MRRAVERHGPERVIVTSAGEWRLLSAIKALDLGIPIEIREDDRFFASTGRFAVCWRPNPTASSGAYIDRMYDFCKTCVYDVKVRSGPTACPFNFLYWAFLISNASLLRANQRLAMPYRTLAG